ncbi:unnamed protein product [Toxocara canis]|uniref:Salivary secreted protein n=1 Tax=Toxocara canis TaxID=6265 RepID=A0A183UX69_TOXCA|nr:unnamed protein product [Toxocara canis]
MNVLASFTITICALAASALASDSELAIPLVCPEELKEHFSKMTDREKSHELQKLQAQNTSALLMMNFMSEYVNWDEFLYDLPVMVTELGKLMLFSDKRDFTLFKEGVTYKYIQRPESFRATLVQLAHTEWTALHAAHHNMDTIRLNTLSVPGIFRLIFRILNREIATLSAQSDQKDSLKVLMKEKAEFEAKVNSSAKMLEAVNGELNRQLDRVKHLQNEYDDAQRKAKPKIGEIFACALIDIVKFAPTMISNVFGGRMGSSHGGSGGQLPSPQDDQMSGSGNEQVSELNEAISVTNKLDTVLEKSELESKTADIIDECLGKVATFRNKILKDLLTSFLQQVKNAYKAVGGVGDENRTIMKQKAATEMLIAANKQYEGLFNKKLGIMERNSEYIAKLTVIDFTQIDFKAILEVMREGIVALGRHIEQWKRFLEFFKIIENLTLLASERTQLFVNGTLMGINDGALMNVYGNDDIYMDMLYEHSFVTIDIAKALNEMTSTYVRVSNKHVFPRLNGIAKLLALEDPVEINAAFKQLAADAQTATEEFKAELKKDYNKQQQRVRERVNEVSCYMRLLEEDPYVKKAIEANDNDVQVPDF